MCSAHNERFAQISLDDFVPPTQSAITTQQYGQLLTALGIGKYLTQVQSRGSFGGGGGGGGILAPLARILHLPFINIFLNEPLLICGPVLH